MCSSNEVLKLSQSLVYFNNLHVIVFVLRVLDLIWMQIKILTIVKDTTVPLFQNLIKVFFFKVYKKNHSTVFIQIYHKKLNVLNTVVLIL